jgi:glycosyltransferase involved in cell wall biosynthesis
VVCSHVGGLSEVVEHGVTGFLVEPGNVDELRDRLSEILLNPELATRLGRNARTIAVERFTWDACAERCLAAYGELMSERHGTLKRGRRTYRRPEARTGSEYAAVGNRVAD